MASCTARRCTSSRSRGGRAPSRRSQPTIRTLPGATYAVRVATPAARRPARPRRAARGRCHAPATRRRPRGRPRPRRAAAAGPDPTGQPDGPAVELGDEHPVPAGPDGRQPRRHPRRQEGQAGAETVVRRGDRQPGEDVVDRVGVAGLERADVQAGAGHAQTVLGPPVTDLSANDPAGSPASGRRRTRSARRPPRPRQRLEDGRRDLLARRQHGDARWVRRDQLDADPADGVGGACGLRRGEERVAWRHPGHRLDGVHGRSPTSGGAPRVVDGSRTGGRRPAARVAAASARDATAMTGPARRPRPGARPPAGRPRRRCRRRRCRRGPGRA